MITCHLKLRSPKPQRGYCRVDSLWGVGFILWLNPQVFCLTLYTKLPLLTLIGKAPSWGLHTQNRITQSRVDAPLSVPYESVLLRIKEAHDVEAHRLISVLSLEEINLLGL